MEKMRTESVQMLRKTSGGDNPLRGESLRYEDWLRVKVT